MKLSQKALQKINTQDIRLVLAMKLGVTEQSIIRYIKANDDELTKAVAMQVIRERTGLEDSEILEGTEVAA